VALEVIAALSMLRRTDIALQQTAVDSFGRLVAPFFL
jgi:hypothetical protein